MSKIRIKVTKQTVHFEPELKYYESSEDKVFPINHVNAPSHLIVEQDGQCYDATFYNVMFPIKEKFDEIEGEERKVTKED